MNSTSPSLLSRIGLPGIVAAVIGLIAVPVVLSNLWTNLDAHEIMVIQAPVSGALHVYTDSGWKWQGFGKVTKYPRRAQYSFSAAKDQGKEGSDQSILTRFNDGGTGHLSGVISWDMPLDTAKVIQLHREFGSLEAIDQQLIRPMIEKVIYNVGPTMSSTESSAERRPEIPQYIDDQLVNGPYLTQTKTVVQHDTLSNADKEVKVVEIAMGADGHPQRSASSQISEHGIKLYPVTVDNIAYNDVVEGQIKQRQEATTQVQIAQANARRAEQDAITIAKQGEAAAAKAKWEQETINAKAIALAQQKLQVATLAAQTAIQYKQQQISEGEGDAEKKRLMMSANNALDVKLDAYVKVQQAWADAFSKYTGAVVPATVFGGAPGTGQGNAAQNFMDIVTMKAARDLNVDMSTQSPAKK